MYRILTCLTVQHDYRLVVLAALICAAAALTTFKIYSHVASSHGLRRLSLLLLTSVCCASGIWATHFIAMLAYDAGFPIAYEPVTTAASFLIAVVATAFGFVISASGSRWHPSVGGAVIGVGIGLMHYTGMRALIVPGTLHWDTTLVVASLVVGAVFASIAMIRFYQLSGRHALWSAAGLFALAICGLHFTAMGAVIVVPDPTIFVPPSPIDASLMVFAVSGATVMIMLSGIASTAFMENHIRRQREQELQIQNLRFDMALGNMSDGLCMFDAEKRLVVGNNRYCEMYRLPPELSKAGTPHEEIIKHRVVHGILKGEANESAAEQKISALNALPSDTISSRIDELADGRLICVTRQPMAGGGWVATHLDVTQRRQSEAKIAYMARHDDLTGIANRGVLLEKMDEALANLRRRGEAFTFFMLDLDQFKTINDSLGHPAGDALLREVATRLKALLRETDVLSRLGGDEFAIIQAGEANQREAASALADRIIEIIAKPFDIDGNELNIGTSIGITLAPEHSTNSDGLLKMADMALYGAKSAGRNVYRFFEPAMSEAASARHEIESELRGAILNSELELHYQPIVDTKTRKVCGVEALIRWRHPTKGLIFPDRFIRLAEETGLITQLGKWVLHTACAEAATWPADIKVAVNLSPVQFRKSNLFDIVTCALAESGLPPERLELEITETALIESAAESLAALHRFKNLGITIVLDDFGTGYSSLSQLTMFAFDKIKIDKSFIQNMTKRSECAAIISATLTLARSLEIATTAEGVEKVEQYRLLRMAGVTSLQGHLFMRPGPASEIDFVKVYGGLKIKDAA